MPGLTRKRAPGVRNVFFENCDLSSPNLNQAMGLNINALRGGTIEHIYFRDIRIGEVSAAPIHDVTSRNCTFGHIGEVDLLDHVRRLERINVKENGKLVA